jgi:16S rRNA G966 N2-methylase RsmD
VFRARLLQADVDRALARLAGEGERFDVVFLDPPYEADLVEATLVRLGEGGVTRPRAIVVAQHLTKRPPPPAIGVLVAFRTRRFGETTLTFYRHAEPAPPAPRDAVDAAAAPLVTDAPAFDDGEAAPAREAGPLP